MAYLSKLMPASANWPKKRDRSRGRGDGEVGDDVADRPVRHRDRLAHCSGVRAAISSARAPRSAATWVQRSVMLAAPVADRAHGKVPEDDPNATERRFPGNQTRSYRTTEPLRVMEEITGW